MAAIFGTILLILAALLHIYVFTRAGSVPLIQELIKKPVLYCAGATLWLLFAFARVFSHGSRGAFAAAMEFLGMSWLASLFLIATTLFAVDAVTLFGLVLKKHAPAMRGCGILVGIVLSGAALVQGLRAPAVVNYEVAIAGLPVELDGKVIVSLSDLHLGNQLGEGWARARIGQIQALKPDLVAFTGDVFEGHGEPDERLLAPFRELRPPLGVWAVTGNHEYHHGGGSNALSRAGFQVLDDRWVQVAPGLVLAGVDDLFSRRRHGASDVGAVEKALAGRPAGVTILLSHAALEVGVAAREGVRLMLSGHTHGGQIWPFGELVRLETPYIAGRYEVGAMSLIVSRGTGLWGPRMRLWHRGEILRITLKRDRAQLAPASQGTPRPGID